MDTRNKTPIFKEMAQVYANLDFMRDDKGRFTEVARGWYQDSSSELYYYDGVIWDRVPEVTMNNLEFLG